MADFPLTRNLSIGETLSQNEVEEVFGTDFGYQFKGITYRHPDEGKYVILLANEGAIYADEFGSGSEFTYTGEDVEEKGDQIETPANKALIDAADEPIPIYLFTSEDGVDEYEYRGLANVEDHEYVTDGTRMVYRFHMRELGIGSWEAHRGNGGESMTQSTDKRLTCDRFFGGVSNRIENLHTFIQYVEAESPTEDAANEWLREEFDADSETTRSQYLNFLRSLNLVDSTNGEYRLGPAGKRYLADPDSETLFALLDGAVAGFDLLLDALASMGPLSDEELRLILNSGPYGHDMEGAGVAIRHREWLQALGYAERDSQGGGPTRTGLTEAGYELWEAYEDGLITPIESEEETSELATSPLQDIADNPVPETTGEVTEEETIFYESNKESQRAATTEHEQAVGRLRSIFEERGFTCKKTRHSDLIAYKTGGPVFVFEVKSTSTGDLWGRIRKAVGQVVEYRYSDVIQREEFAGESTPGLFLSSEPPQPMMDYLSHLETEYGIAVLWWDGGLTGPSLDALD
ncbi:hypothetical protein [Halobacterium wangiae]|uniref:hypothetical protein n=1 Tax=Halobacterium wangiae TaxID=2902623 RepID=UPI001E4A3426|nr:hypothetical protein [Halobacterium wangiae]